MSGQKLDTENLGVTATPMPPSRAVDEVMTPVPWYNGIGLYQQSLPG